MYTRKPITSRRGAHAAALLANGINQRAQAYLDQLIARTRGHGEMCPCEACQELRSL